MTARVDLDFIKAFIGCLTRATERCGETFHAPGIQTNSPNDCWPCNLYNSGLAPSSPQKPYFMSTIAYTYIRPFQTNERDWLVYVSYTFDLNGWSQMIYYQRIVPPSVASMNDELVDWICGAVTSLKQEREKASPGLYVV